MSFLICPECGEYNPLEAEICQACQASLVGVTPTEEPALSEPEQSDFDLFAEGDADLPDFLESLKQEELLPAAGDTPAFELDADSEEGVTEGEKSPDWLDVVRKRAREEEDAVGDLIKRVSGAQERLKQEKRESQHEDFETWIQKLRDEARDKAAGGTVQKDTVDQPPEEDEEDEPKWLTRLRKTHGVPEEGDGGPDAAGRSLLEWLVELEDQRTSGESSQEIEATQRITIPVENVATDATQEIRTSTVQEGQVPSTLDLTREDREQADQLKATIVDETADRSSEARKYRKPLSILSIFFALVLIVGMAFMLVTGRVLSFTSPDLPAAGQAVLDWVKALPEDAEVLLVFDYRPAFAAEMERVVGPILSEVFDAVDSVDVIQSSAAGVLLSAEMLADYPDLTVTDLGYFPGEAYGAFGAAGELSGDYSDVMILSDQFESAQAWVEQWQTLAPETTINLLVTAQAGPLLRPYVESGQVHGLISGLAEAVVVEAGLGERGAATSVWQAYQLGILVMIGALVLGGLAGVGKNSRLDERGGR